MSIDWKDCPYVEARPDRLSGKPTIVNTRIPPETLIVNREHSAEWLGDQFGVPVRIIRGILAYVDRIREGT